QNVITDFNFVNKYVDAVPFLEEHLRNVQGARSPDELRMRRVACRLYFWQRLADEATNRILQKASNVKLDESIKELLKHTGVDEDQKKDADKMYRELKEKLGEATKSAKAGNDLQSEAESNPSKSEPGETDGTNSSPDG
ncbi:hypothetical protein D6833_10290, partial [Candidatus Parcubacteria bacterium]